MGCSTSVASKSIAVPVAILSQAQEEPPTERPHHQLDSVQKEKEDESEKELLPQDPGSEQKHGEPDNLKNQSIEQNLSVCNQTSKISYPQKKPLKGAGYSNNGGPKPLM